MSVERKRKANELASKGATHAEIAAEIGVSTATVARDLKKPSQGIVERVKTQAVKTVERAKEVVRPTTIPLGRIEEHKIHAIMIKATLRGEDYPREYRIKDTVSTGKKSIAMLNAAIAAADVDMDDDEKMDRIIWAHLEAMEAEHGHRA